MKSTLPRTRHTSRRQWRWIHALTLSLLGATSAPVAFAAPTEAGIEATRTSKLVPVELPAGAIRSTSAPDVAKFASVLQTIAGLNKGKISQTEVLIWEKAAQPLVKYPASLRGARYKYEEQPSGKWEDLGNVTPFGLESADASRHFIGLWIEQEEYTLLAWGAFQFDAAKATPATPATPPKKTPNLGQLADKLAQSVNPAAPANNPSVLLVKDANDVMRGSATPKMPTFTKLTRQPKTVRGQVKDGAGKPIVGAQIITQTSYAGGFRTDNKGKTNAQGIYEVALPNGISQIVNADCVVRYNGKRYTLPLEPADGERDEFNTATGHIENFVLRTYGIADPSAENHPEWGSRYYGGHIRMVGFYDMPEGGVLQVVLTPQGPLLDGTQGRTFDVRLPNKGNSEMFINDVPLGRYEMKVQVMNGANQPLRVKKIYGNDEFHDTLTVDFQPNDGDIANLGQSGAQQFEVVLGP